MQAKILSSQSLFIATIMGSTVSLMIFFVLAVASPVEGFNTGAQHAFAINEINGGGGDDIVLAASKKESLRPVTLGLPVRLVIPNVNIDTLVEHVGVTAKGELAVPKGPTTAAWYKLGPRPGEIGSAVIDGHFGWKNGAPAVFDNLSKLHKGDKLYVKDERGVTTTFVVSKFKTYSQNDSAGEVFRSNDGKAHLNLITCAGTWDNKKKSFTKRLVVFADKVLEQ